MRLKKKFIPYFYLLMIISIFSSFYFLGNAISKYLPTVSKENPVIDIIDEQTIPVNNEIKNIIIKPFIDNSGIIVDKQFYDAESDIKQQENSLILFDNTYMQSTGIYYKSENEFKIVSVLDGEVKLITDDNILGTIVEISHDNDLVSVYQSINNVTVKIGDKIKQGDIIGTSGINKLGNNKNNLLFELYCKGNILNPEKYYNTDANEITT